MVANAWHWLTAHWELVCIGIYIAINILNAASRHWSEHTGFVKAVLFVTETLSILSSAGRTPFLKPPLDVDKHGPVAALAPFVLAGALSLTLAGCCSTPRCYLARSLTAVSAADKLAAPALDAACTSRIKACGAVPVESCPPFKQCTAAATGYQVAMDAIGRALAACNRALSDAGVK